MKFKESQVTPLIKTFIKQADALLQSLKANQEDFKLNKAIFDIVNSHQELTVNGNYELNPKKNTQPFSHYYQYLKIDAFKFLFNLETLMNNFKERNELVDTAR